MRVRLGDLRRLLWEYVVRPDITLYHRSHQKFKVGDVLTAQTDKNTGKHWLSKKPVENELEKHRQENYPNLPSRMNCVYATFSPRSRFIGKGYLYAVRPVGKTHVTDSRIIDRMSGLGGVGYSDYDFGYDSALFDDYWRGVEPRRGNLFDMEVLMDKAEVVEVIDEKGRLIRGMKFKFGSDAPSIRAELSINSSKDEPLKKRTFAADGNQQIPFNDAMSRLDVPGLKTGEIKSNSWGQVQAVELGPGFEGVVCTYRSDDPVPWKKSKDEYYTPKISVSPGDAVDGGGVSLTLDSVAARAFIKAYRAGKIERR